MVIGRLVLDQMVAHARDGYPNEACGLLAARNGVVTCHYPIRNAEESPVQYRLDPSEQLQAMLDMDAHEWDLAAIYHSHTHTRAYPSETDIRLAAYPEPLYIIASLAGYEPDVRGFRIVRGAVTEETLSIDDKG